LERLFANEIGIDSKTILSFSGITFANAEVAALFAKYDFISTAGASIAPIGMVPMKYMENVTRKNDMVAVITISSLVALTSLVLWIISSQQLYDAQREKTRLTKEINNMDSINGIYSENLELKGKNTGLDTLKILCFSSNENLLPLITQLEEKLPSDVTVHSISATGNEVLMNFTADSKEIAAMTLSQIKKIDIITSVKTAGIAQEKDDIGVNTISFSVSANYVMPKQNTEEAK